MKTNSGKIIVLTLIALFLAASCVVGISSGEAGISILWNFSDELQRTIFQQVRLPRVILGGLVGAALAVSGAILQGVMRNPLAEPGIIGVSAGGGLAGIVIMLILPAYSFLLVPASFCGALAAACCVYLTAWRGGVTPLRLILSGVALTSLMWALSGLALTLNPDKAPRILAFSSGSLAHATWDNVTTALPYVAAGLSAAFAFAHPLNILALGDESASGLGLNVEKMRIFFIAAAALLAAVSVSVAGLLGFVGLLAPHIVRMLSGSDFRTLIPASAAFGAGMVILCDAAGRAVAPPFEIPVGIVMALLGPPFFVYLLWRRCDET